MTAPASRRRTSSASSNASTRRIRPAPTRVRVWASRLPDGSSTSTTARSPLATTTAPVRRSRFRSGSPELGESPAPYVALIAPGYVGVMYDIALDHAGGLRAALMMLVFGAAFVLALRLLAARRVALAVAVAHAYGAAPFITKLAATLMLLSGGIHPALVPGHDGITGVLFVFDGLGFIGLAFAAFVTTWWRRPAP